MGRKSGLFRPFYVPQEAEEWCKYLNYRSSKNREFSTKTYAVQFCAILRVLRGQKERVPPLDAARSSGQNYTLLRAMLHTVQASAENSVNKKYMKQPMPRTFPRQASG